MVEYDDILEEDENDYNSELNNPRLLHYDTEFFTERLKFLWEQYMKIIQIILLLSGFTVITIINVVLKIQENGKPLEHQEYVMSSIIIAAVAGLLALGWRFAAQILMERQIYGDSARAKKFFETTKTTPPWALKSDSLAKVELSFDILKYTSGPLLLVSWVFIIYFFYLNLNQ